MKTNKEVYNSILDVLLQSREIMMSHFQEEKDILLDEMEIAKEKGDRYHQGCVKACLTIVEKMRIYLNNLDLVKMTLDQIDEIEAE